MRTNIDLVALLNEEIEVDDPVVAMLRDKLLACEGHGADEIEHELSRHLCGNPYDEETLSAIRTCRELNEGTFEIEGGVNTGYDEGIMREVLHDPRYHGMSLEHAYREAWIRHSGNDE